MDWRPTPETRSVTDIVRPPIWRAILGRRRRNAVRIKTHIVISIT
jgi:hypothetical protein